MVAKILDTAEVDEILTFDLHHHIIGVAPSVPPLINPTTRFNSVSENHRFTKIFIVVCDDME